MYTLFVDGRPAADITGSPDHSSASVRSIASLSLDPPMSRTLGRAALLILIVGVRAWGICWSAQLFLLL